MNESMIIKKVELILQQLLLIIEPKEYSQIHSENRYFLVVGVVAAAMMRGAMNVFFLEDSTRMYMSVCIS